MVVVVGRGRAGTPGTGWEKLRDSWAGSRDHMAGSQPAIHGVAGGHSRCRWDSSPRGQSSDYWDPREEGPPPC